MPARGCGTRQAGGIYAVTELSPFGKPLEFFLYCPPKLIPDGIVVSAQGQQILEVEDQRGFNAQYMLDWVGGDSYPNVLDFVEEVRCLGASFHISPTVAAQLRPPAWAWPVHGRAIIENWGEYPGRFFGDCPKDKHSPVEQGHTDREMDWFDEVYPGLVRGDNIFPETMCSGYWWEDIVGGEPVTNEDQALRRIVRRQMPSFSYHGLSRPESVTPIYRAAIIARLPIHCLQIIAGGETTDQYYESLKSGDLPVSVVKE